jgi:arylformamidase
MNSRWIDITVPLHNGMVSWPGDRPYMLERQLEMERGHHCNLSSVTMSVHTGTHMDAPLHFVSRARSIDQLPLDATIGPARVVEIRTERIEGFHLDDLELQEGERLILKTPNSDQPWFNQPFRTQFTHLAPSAAERLAAARLRCLGIDYLSVGGYQRDGAETHRILLEAGIWIIEGLHLHDVTPGEYQLICLPLKLLAAEGSPARALLLPLEEHP